MIWVLLRKAGNFEDPNVNELRITHAVIISLFIHIFEHLGAGSMNASYVMTSCFAPIREMLKYNSPGVIMKVPLSLQLPLLIQYLNHDNMISSTKFHFVMTKKIKSSIIIINPSAVVFDHQTTAPYECL